MARIDTLKQFLADDPRDSFARYALALEYVSLGQDSDALREFQTVRENDPSYLATYYQLGQLYQKLGMIHEAEKAFREGIQTAVRAGDAHTESELESALNLLLGV